MFQELAVFMDHEQGLDLLVQLKTLPAGLTQVGGSPIGAT
jgi:hypothetical protein